MPRKGLGRGIAALIDTTPDRPVAQATENGDIEVSGNSQGVQQIDIRKIEPNREQPRQYFDDTALRELADSIKSYGIIQPILLKDCGDYYKIIAGERRFRAARIAGLDEVPAIVNDYTEAEILQIALIENIQRQDLTPIEEAICYKRLIDDYFFTADSIADKVGKNRAAVSSIVRLLELDERVQDIVAAGRITVSHARVLLGLKNGDTQYAAAEQVAEEDLSVRAAEALVNKLNQPVKEELELPEEKMPLQDLNPDVSAAYRQAEVELQTLLGAKVNILRNKNRGKIEIEYYSPDELDRLLGIFKLNIAEGK